MADFQKRGFRLSAPEQREVLETHARSFLNGFNLAVLHWRSPHSALSLIDPQERGFAYEGAAMYAGLRDYLTCGRARAFQRLLSGAGAGYVHLVHVGAGWSLVPLRLPLRTRIPATPLLGWLALDGTGFAKCFFGGREKFRRMCSGGSGGRWEATLAGCGRALWFIESVDIENVSATIDAVPARARPHVWSGVGLASCYAGGLNAEEYREMKEKSGVYWPYLGQGALFAMAARARSGIVPEHTVTAARSLLSIDVEEANEWTNVAARGLTESRELSAYLEWKTRLREMARAHS